MSNEKSRILLEYDGKDIVVTAKWPTGDPERRELSAKEIATIVANLTTGRLLATIQQAITKAGVAYGDEEVATLALQYLNVSLKNMYGERQDSLVVRPSQAF